jgi:hypothetical protein
VFACVLGILTVLLLPPRAAAAHRSAFGSEWPVVRGAYHIHSERSDGTGTLDDIASAAAAAGLQFVIITDHGDGTRLPEPPAYRSGVLCIDGVEISTQYGHYVALGMARAPYPLGGHPRDVIEDVRRFGGFGFAAHPGSPKAALQWDDWDAPLDGVEWLNADSEWRDEFWGSLGRVLLTYAFRPVETLAGLLDRPEQVLAKWDALTSTRRVPAIAGADAHARLGFGQRNDPYDDRVIARVPSYGVSFRAFVNHVVLNRPLTGDATIDASELLSAVREGRMYTSIDGLAHLGGFAMKAGSGTATARPGEYLAIEGPAAIEARVTAPEGSKLVVRRNAEVLYETDSDTLRIDIGTQPGVYRIEAFLPPRVSASSVPWVLTNPIYVGLREVHRRVAASSPQRPPAASVTPIATASWRAEASEGSSSALRQGALYDGTPAVEWRFRLSAGPRAEQYAAIHFPVAGGLAGQDRVQLRAYSDAPRRLWAQLRVPGTRGGERWGASFYVTEELRAIDLRFEDFRPMGTVSSERPPLDRVDSLLFVVDTVNTLPGTAGTFWIPDLWLAR